MTKVLIISGMYLIGMGLAMLLFYGSRHQQRQDRKKGL